MPPLKLNLFEGDFQANYPKADAPAFVLKAQTYLDSLTGTDDALFYENADLRGRELIRLKGIENAEGVVAQSQFALRFKNGGGVGGGAFSRALTAGGGALAGGVPLGGGGVGGLGGGSGGGGLLTNPNGNGTTFTNVPGGGTTTTPPPTTPPTTTTDVPPVNEPPEEPPKKPPEEPDTPTNPVPAPAGLLLGAIALGTLGTWRIGVRALKSK